MFIRKLTGADNAGVLAVHTVVNSNAVVATLEDVGLIPKTQNIVQPNGTIALAIRRLAQRSPIPVTNRSHWSKMYTCMHSDIQDS